MSRLCPEACYNTGMNRLTRRVALTAALALALAPTFAQGPKKKGPIVVIQTTRGVIKIKLFPQVTPITVANYLKLVNNPKDELPFKRLVRLLRGIGGKSADKLWQRFSSMFLLSGSESANNPAESEARNEKRETPLLATALQKCANSVPKKAAVAPSVAPSTKR